MIHIFEPLKGMMRPQKASKKSGSSSKTLFQDALETTASAPPEETQKLNTLAWIGPFLSSYTPGGSADTKHAIDHAHDMLEQLDILRDGLLSGRYSHRDLDTLKHCLDHIPTEHVSQEVTSVIQEIRLRVAVEWEKLQRGQTAVSA